MKMRRRRFGRRRRRNNGLATIPRMMPRALAYKRHNQVSTKTFWFKINGTQQVQASGNALGIFRTRGLTDGPAPQGKPELFTLYDQYKILAMRLRWFPANVGTEPGTNTIGPAVFLRGDQVVWSDQRIDSSIQIPIFIADVISNASARMINPRRPYTRVIYRPKGYPEWGSCVNDTTNPDPWNAAIYQMINSATPIANRPLWYYVLTYKVVFRGRRQN